MKIILPNRIQFVAMFLMALFALVIVPKELWHNCDEHVHNHHHSEDGNTEHGTLEDGAHCAICDFQILPFTHSLKSVDFSPQEDFISVSTDLTSNPTTGSRFTLLGRGPPALAV